MRGLVGLLLLSGCLYVGDVNRAPTSSLTMVDAPDVLIKGAPLQLVGTVNDAESGSALPGNYTVELLEAPDFDPQCDYWLTNLGGVGRGARPAEVVFYRTGNWMISFQTVDRLGAPSNTSTLMVQVVDSPPTFSSDPANLLVKEATDPECKTYVAGQPLTVYYDGTVTDLDAAVGGNAGCSESRYQETLSYRWELIGLPANSHAVLGPKPSETQACPANPPVGLTTTWTAQPGDVATAVCVYPDVGHATVPDMYQVALFVSDGNTEIRTNLFQAPVRSDLPPCLTGAAPAPGSYVVDRSQVQRFTVTGATDDLDPFGGSLGFAWSIWREQDPEWRQVPDWSLATYAIDTSDFAVGEKLRVRVQPLDRLGARASCDVDMSTCITDSCLLGTGLACQAWMTWDLELR